MSIAVFTLPTPGATVNRISIPMTDTGPFEWNIDGNAKAPYVNWFVLEADPQRRNPMLKVGADNKSREAQMIGAYPVWLIRWFGIGAIAFVVGLAMVIASLVISSEKFSMIAAAIWAFGSASVFLTMLQGERYRDARR